MRRKSSPKRARSASSPPSSSSGRGPAAAATALACAARGARCLKLAAPPARARSGHCGRCAVGRACPQPPAAAEAAAQPAALISRGAFSSATSQVPGARNDAARRRAEGRRARRLNGTTGGPGQARRAVETLADLLPNAGNTYMRWISARRGRELRKRAPKSNATQKVVSAYSAEPRLAARHGDGSAMWRTSCSRAAAVQQASSRPPRSQYSDKVHAACLLQRTRVTPAAASSTTAASSDDVRSASDSCSNRAARKRAKSAGGCPPARALRLVSRLRTNVCVCCRYSSAKLEDGEPTGDAHLPAMTAATALTAALVGGTRTATRSQSRRKTSIAAGPSRARGGTSLLPPTRQTHTRRTEQPDALSSSVHSTPPSRFQKKAYRRSASSPAPLQRLAVSQAQRRRET